MRSTRPSSSATTRAARPAGHRRRHQQPRRGRRGELRSAQVRRALGHADPRGAAPLPARHLREAAHVGVPRGVAPGVRDLSRVHAGGRRPVARRGLPRRHREPRAEGRRGHHRARASRTRIRAATQLTASVGVAPNKLVAKIASDLEQARRAHGRARRTTCARCSIRCPCAACPASAARLGERVEAAGLAHARRSCARAGRGAVADLRPRLAAHARAGRRHRRPPGDVRVGREVDQRRGNLLHRPRRPRRACRPKCCGSPTAPARACARRTSPPAACR